MWQFDAVNAIERTHSNYYVDAVAPEGASREAATAASHHFGQFVSNTKAAFDTQLALSLAEVADGQSENDGVDLGECEQILAWRVTMGQATWSRIPQELSQVVADSTGFSSIATAVARC